MPDRLIFVSCGKRTPEETQLGRLVEREINSREGFTAYLADSVQSLAALGHHVFDALRRCAGAVVLLHEREATRSSMWINQELAILAYRQFFESREIPILVFKDENVRLEGAMTAFIVNAKPLPNEQVVLEELHRWITDKAGGGPPDEQAIFDQKWTALQPDDYMILKAVIEEGSHNVKDFSVRRRLVKNGLDNNTASSILRTRRAAMSQQNLLRINHNKFDGDEISLHPNWEWYVRHIVSKRVVSE
jgi:hypothetical protein